MWFVVSPAYGREYKSGKAAREDWLAGKDFVNQSHPGGRYINKNNVPAGASVEIRFDRMTKLTVVK